MEVTSYWGTVEWQHTEWATTCGKVGEGDLGGDADPIGVRGGRYRAFDVATRILVVEELCVGKTGNVYRSWRVVCNDSGVAENTGDGVGDGLCASISEEGSHKD